MTLPRLLDAPAIDAAAPLDMLLTQGALGAGSRLLPITTTVAFGRALASRPRRVAARAGTLAAELGRVAVGASALVPERRDKRFADPAWTENPLLRRLVQAYLAAGQAAEGLAQDVPMEWREGERVRFVVSNVVEALSPSNNPLTSPVAWKAAIDTGGLSAVRGVRNLVRDMSTAPRVPSMVDRSAFVVGTHVAGSAGAVVLRTPHFELLHYAPTTEAVRTEPLLIIPPTINKFYVLDLGPGRSMIEHLVGSGQQVFVVSWRNPDARHSKWGLDTYTQAILDAMAAVREICAVERTHVMAACSGGILASMVASHLEQTGQQDLLASLTLLVTVLDQEQAGTTGAFIDEGVAAAAIAASRRKGYLDGRKLAEVFAWLRPSDLIWNYWVNNYLTGKQPPAFDILAWNADTTRMTARLHADFLTMAMSNALIRPGGVTVLGTDVDLQKVGVDSYIVAGVADHLCKWQSCYRSTQMLGGSSRFILSTSGHIAALVNPPSNPKSSFLATDEDVKPSTDAAEWQTAAVQHQGSWWPDYTQWLTARSGEPVEAPAELGSNLHRVLEAAPGSYVLDA
ncbi:MAG: Poly-beta-hydroxybutyrate polymerase domain protein [Frankiales bacterium]|nr:Poly-beta-hydroxybutyrate polymerase domain protein [Frankiales bacterium]